MPTIQTLGLFDIQTLNLVAVLWGPTHNLICGIVDKQNFTLWMMKIESGYIIRSSNGILFVGGDRIYLRVQV